MKMSSVLNDNGQFLYRQRSLLEHVEVISCAVLCFAALNPYFLWTIGKEVQFLMLCVFSMAVFIDRYHSLKKIAAGLFLASMIFLYSMLYGMSAFGACYVALFSLLISVVSKDVLLKAFSLFKYFFVCCMVPGLILWFLHNVLLDKSFLFMGYVDDEYVPNQLKVEAGFRYATYPFSVVLDYMLEWPYYRIFGPFDEPGRVGTIAALLLAIERFDLKHISNMVIFLVGLLSFSLAFYVLSLLFLVVYFSRRPVIILLLLMCSISAGVVLSENAFFKAKIIDRFSVSSEGKLSGDNRTGASLEENFIAWRNAPVIDYIIGFKNLPAEEGSSWKLIPIRSGLLGVISFVTFFISIYVVCNGFRLPFNLAFLMVFSASIYQRPDVVSPALLLIFFAGSIVYSKRFNFHK